MSGSRRSWPRCGSVALATASRRSSPAASDFVAGFIGVSNLIERDGRHVTVRPEKIRILDDTEQSEPGAHVESGVVREVIYLGAVTRYVVDLEAAGQLVVVRQNLDNAEQALQA